MNVHTLSLKKILVHYPHPTTQQDQVAESFEFFVDDKPLADRLGISRGDLKYFKKNMRYYEFTLS